MNETCANKHDDIFLSKSLQSVLWGKFLHVHWLINRRNFEYITISDVQNSVIRPWIYWREYGNAMQTKTSLINSIGFVPYSLWL